MVLSFHNALWINDLTILINRLLGSILNFINETASKQEALWQPEQNPIGLRVFPPEKSFRRITFVILIPMVLYVHSKMLVFDGSFVHRRSLPDKFCDCHFRFHVVLVGLQTNHLNRSTSN